MGGQKEGKFRFGKNDTCRLDRDRRTTREMTTVTDDSDQEVGTRVPEAEK